MFSVSELRALPEEIKKEKREREGKKKEEARHVFIKAPHTDGAALRTRHKLIGQLDAKLPRCLRTGGITSLILCRIITIIALALRF